MQHDTIITCTQEKSYKYIFTFKLIVDENFESI